MANEIQMSANIRVQSGSLREDITPGSINIDLASVVSDAGVQNVGASLEAFTNDAASDGGVFFFRNLSTTYYVEIGGTDNDLVGGTFVAFLKLLPGEYAVGRLSDATLFAKAESGSTVDVQFKVFSP